MIITKKTRIRVRVRLHDMLNEPKGYIGDHNEKDYGITGLNEPKGQIGDHNEKDYGITGLNEPKGQIGDHNEKDYGITGLNEPKGEMCSKSWRISHTMIGLSE